MSTPNTSQPGTGLEQLYTPAEAAAAVNRPERAIRHLFDKRAFPLVKMGRRVYVRRSDLAAYLTASTIPARESK
jgi:excisionase family DNA binding protein